MAEEKSREEQISDELVKANEEFAQEVEDAVEEARPEVESYYEDLAKRDEAREFSLRAYQQGESLTPEQYLERTEQNVDTLDAREEAVLEAQKEEQEEQDVAGQQAQAEAETEEDDASASTDADVKEEGDQNVSPQSEAQGAPVSPDQAAAKVGEGVAEVAPTEEENVEESKDDE
jgi:hypothetical protein